MIPGRIALELLDLGQTYVPASCSGCRRVVLVLDARSNRAEEWPALLDVPIELRRNVRWRFVPPTGGGLQAFGPLDGWAHRCPAVDGVSCVSTTNREKHA